MINFERSTDYPLIRSILTEPALYRRMRNDGAPEPERFEVTPRADLVFIVATCDAGPAGVFILKLTAPCYAEVHFCLRKPVWFMSKAIARAFLSWVWRETSLHTLIGEVPSYNALARRLAESVGFEKTESIPSTVAHNGATYSTDVLILKRPIPQEIAA